MKVKFILNKYIFHMKVTMQTTTPTLNNLSSSSWVAQIPGQEELTIKLTEFEIPGVDAGVTPLGNRSEFILQVSGDHIQYDNLELKFLIDENLLNYRKLYKWMRSNVKNGQDENVSIFIHFVGNDRKFQGVEIEFLEAFPINISSISLDTTSNTTDVECTVTFAYTGFDFVDETDRDS